MPLNVTVFNLPAVRNGAAATSPTLTSDTAAMTVALGTGVAVTGPALLALIPDEDQRIALAKSGPYAAPAASGIKLKAGIERRFELRAGSWFLNVVAG